MQAGRNQLVITHGCKNSDGIATLKFSVRCTGGRFWRQMETDKG